MDFWISQSKSLKKRERQCNLQMVAISLFFQIMTTTLYFYPRIIKAAAQRRCVLGEAQLSLWFQFSATSWALMEGSALWWAQKKDWTFACTFRGPTEETKQAAVLGCNFQVCLPHKGNKGKDHILMSLRPTAPAWCLNRRAHSLNVCSL